MLSFRNKFNKLIKKDNHTIREFIEYFKHDGIFAILFIITFPTSIPSPAYAFGSSTMLGGFITIFLSIQILMGRQYVYLPEFILRKKFDVSYFRENIHGHMDYALLKMETIFKKRNDTLFNALFLKMASVLMILNAILMVIPLMMTNWLPSTAISAISFSYLFKDGFMFALSLIFSCCVIIFYYTLFDFVKSYILKNKERVYTLVKKYLN